MFRDLDKRQPSCRFISSLFFLIFFSFKLIFQHNKTYTQHLFSFIRLCKKVFHVLMLVRFSRGFFYQFYAFFFLLFGVGKIPLVLHVPSAVDFHLAIKQPFAINFHTTTNDVHAKSKKETKTSLELSGLSDYLQIAFSRQVNGTIIFTT